MSIVFVKTALNYAKDNFSTEIFNQYIKKMSDYSLKIAQTVGGNPIICMTASLLHKLADGVSGDFRSNRINPVLREIGFDTKNIDAINDCINNLIPENKDKRKSIEAKVVGDAFILTYSREINNKDLSIPYLEFEISEKLFHSAEEFN